MSDLIMTHPLQDVDDDGENFIFKCNIAFLQSFLDYFKSFGLSCKVLTNYPGIKLVSELKICGQALTSST